MRSVVGGIHTYLAAHPMTDPGATIRARFFRLGSFSLDVELSAYIYARDWDAFLETQQEMLLEVMAIVERNGVVITLPSQTLHVADRRGRRTGCRPDRRGSIPSTGSASPDDGVDVSLIGRETVRSVALGALVCGALAVAPASAQDMEPRAYSASPVGANFLVTSYSWSTGDVVFDPTLPITDIKANVQGLVVAVGHSFNLFGQLALASAAIPYVLADVTGKVFEQQAETHRSGLADAHFKLSVNFWGNPAMSPREFVTAPRHTIVGASVSVTAPASQYYETKLINLGTNRWSFKPEVGVSVPYGRWDLDGYVGAYFYTSNANFYPGAAFRTQESGAGDPGACELHLPATAVGGTRRHVVQGRELARRRRRTLDEPEQREAGCHVVVSRGQAVLPRRSRTDRAWWRGRALIFRRSRSPGRCCG